MKAISRVPTRLNDFLYKKNMHDQAKRSGAPMYLRTCTCMVAVLFGMLYLKTSMRAGVPVLLITYLYLPSSRVPNVTIPTCRRTWSTIRSIIRSNVPELIMSRVLDPCVYTKFILMVCLQCILHLVKHSSGQSSFTQSNSTINARGQHNCRNHIRGFESHYPLTSTFRSFQRKSPMFDPAPRIRRSNFFLVSFCARERAQDLQHTCRYAKVKLKSSPAFSQKALFLDSLYLWDAVEIESVSEKPLTKSQNPARALYGLGSGPRRHRVHWP